MGVPVLAVGHLGLSDSAVGATQAAMGLGGLCGGLLAGVWAGKLRLRHGFFPLLACAPAMLLVGASALPGIGASGWPLLLAGCFCAMAAASLFSVHISAVVQARTPAFLVGKVMSLMMAVAMCMQPLGQFLYGMLFEALGPGAFLVMLFAALAAALLASAPGARSGAWRGRAGARSPPWSGDGRPRLKRDAPNGKSEAPPNHATKRMHRGHASAAPTSASCAACRSQSR